MVQNAMAEKTSIILGDAIARIRCNIGLFNGRFPITGDGFTYMLKDNVN